MLDDKTYRIWTDAFQPGSYAVTTWEKGTPAKFLAPNGDGMVSRIAENIPNEFLSIEHLGMIIKGVEDTTSDDVKAWAGAMENYTLKDNNGNTEVIVEMDSDENYSKMFNEMWPKALEKVKELSEA
jgi:hypothetical protein